MACELYHAACESCNQPRCPEDIAKIKMEYQLLKENAQKAREELARQTVKLARFESKYQDVIGCH